MSRLDFLMNDSDSAWPPRAGDLPHNAGPAAVIIGSFAVRLDREALAALDPERHHLRRQQTIHPWASMRDVNALTGQGYPRDSTDEPARSAATAPH